MPARKYRKCTRCGNNRNVNRYIGTRGRICDTCRSTSRSATTKDARLQEQYEITHREWLAIWISQGEKCALCGGKRTYKGRPQYDVDHDHALEKQGVSIRETLRGLLCKRCNRRLLPACLDSITILQSAIDYLLFGNQRTQRALELVRAGYWPQSDGTWLAEAHTDNAA